MNQRQQFFDLIMMPSSEGNFRSLLFMVGGANHVSARFKADPLAAKIALP